MAIERPTLEQLQDKAFRDAFLERSVRESIAAQVKSLRHQHKLTVREFAARTSLSFATIIRIENPLTNSGTSVKSLLSIAAAFDVALMIKFVAWSRWLVETFVVLPDGALEYFTEQLEPSEDVLRLMEWASTQAEGGSVTQNAERQGFSQPNLKELK